MNQSFIQFLKFAELLHQYRAVERRILIQNSDRLENDQEHSFNLAILAWYLHSVYQLELDLDKVFIYALVHDLVEVYSGDTYIYETDIVKVKNKSKREKEAADRIKKEFPEFTKLHVAIQEYEERKDSESRFIYALDKLEPVISIYVDKGRTWRKEKVSLDMLLNSKAQKVSFDPLVEKIFTDLVVKLREEETELFWMDKQVV